MDPSASLTRYGYSRADFFVSGWLGMILWREKVTCHVELYCARDEMPLWWVGATTPEVCLVVANEDDKEGVLLAL